MSNGTDQAGAQPGRLLPDAGVAVRMYRQGMGDCFLLAFRTAQPDHPFYMLIDCGVILRSEALTAKMKEVAEDIKTATGGDIHLLVVTHEHWDHLSGFIQAREIFEQMRIHNLWLGWTEDPADELARQLRAEFEDEREALRMAARRALNSEAIAHITNVLDFFGDLNLVDGNGGALAAAGRSQTGAALEAVLAFAEQAGTEPEYQRPGEQRVLTTPGGGEVPGVRVYILGPPHDARTLRRINPTVKGKEVYTEDSALTARKAFLFAVRDDAQLSDQERYLRDLSFPFDERVRIPIDAAARFDFFKDHYGFEPGALDAPNSDAWRRINDDWLGAAGELAIQLDSYTNNTSLALAIELTGSGKVLLFTADAQVGNWLSWDNLTWTVTNADGSTHEVKSAELLRRTVLYKVGHHGSHNATIRGFGEEKKGLELMDSPDLVAMVPCDRVMAEQKRWTKIPFEPLVRRLEERTGQRVLKIDEPFPKQQPEGMSDAAWQAFKAKFTETELYMQYSVTE